MELLFQVDKNPLGPYNDPLFQSSVCELIALYVHMLLYKNEIKV